MYEKNLANLEKFNPKLYEAIKKIPVNIDFEKQDNVIKIGKQTLFSKYNPEKEAEQLYNKWYQVNKDDISENILIFGISNPYLMEKFITSFKVTVFIPNIEILKILMDIYDFGNIFEKAKFTFELQEISNDFNDIYPMKLEQKLYNNIFTELKRRLSSALSSPVKILLVKPFYGGSLPVANYCEMNFKKFNVNLKTIDSDKAFGAFDLITRTLNKKDFISDMRIELSNFISKMIFYSIEEFKPDIVFGVAQSPINDKVLKNIREKGIVSGFWFVEDFNLFKYWEYFAPFYDYYFTIQKDKFFSELEKIGVKNYSYLPLACEPEIHRPVKLTKEEKKRFGSILSFVGAGYYNRRRFFRKLLDYDFKIWGSDWEDEPVLSDLIQENGRRVSTEESVKIFNASLININLHSSTFYEGIAPDGDFVNPRTFEIAACKSYQVVDRRKYLFEHFEKDKEVLSFSTESELKNLIKEIIEFPEKYEHIKENGYKRAVTEHTYKERIKSIAKVMGFDIKEKPEKYNSEKDYYLSNFNSLEEISDYISKKEKITKTDAIFLLMKSLKDTYLK